HGFDVGGAIAAGRLARYDRENRQITAKSLDPLEAPGQAARLGIDPSLGGLVARMAGRTETAPTVTEQDVTSSLARLIRNQSTEACFTTGHGEPSVSDTTGGGLAALAQL